jgi:hypothetical protein
LRELKEWIAAVNENMESLKKIEGDTKDLNNKSITRPLTVPQMVTWMLYAAAINNDIMKYRRYPMINLKTYTSFATPQKRSLNSVASPASSSSSISFSSSSSSSSSTNSYN